MPYLDKEEKFYDYKTSMIDGNNIFDTTKTGMSYSNEFITNPSYMQKEKNLKCEFVNMTPMEYFESCAKIFDSTTSKQIAQTRADKVTIDHLHQVLSVYKKRFPVTFLNYAEQTQEGRHRMLVAAEYCGWDVKHPVMVITWDDEDKHNREVETKRKQELERDLRDAVREALKYTFSDISEFESELQYKMNTKFNFNHNDPDVEFDFEYNDTDCKVTYKGVTYTFGRDEIRIDDLDIEDLELDLDGEEDLDSWLAKYLE